jgi:hypothetical protein
LDMLSGPPQFCEGGNRPPSFSPFFLCHVGLRRPARWTLEDVGELARPRCCTGELRRDLCGMLGRTFGAKPVMPLRVTGEHCPRERDLRPLLQPVPEERAVAQRLASSSCSLQSPSCLQHLSFGGYFNQILQCPWLAVPDFDLTLNHSLKNVQLPSGLQRWSLGGCLIQSLQAPAGDRHAVPFEVMAKTAQDWAICTSRSVGLVTRMRMSVS